TIGGARFRSTARRLRDRRNRHDITALSRQAQVIPKEEHHGFRSRRTVVAAGHPAADHPAAGLLLALRQLRIFRWQLPLPPARKGPARGGALVDSSWCPHRHLIELTRSHPAGDPWIVESGLSKTAFDSIRACYFSLRKTNRCTRDFRSGALLPS